MKSGPKKVVTLCFIAVFLTWSASLAFASTPAAATGENNPYIRAFGGHVPDKVKVIDSFEASLVRNSNVVVIKRRAGQVTPLDASGKVPYGQTTPTVVQDRMSWPYSDGSLNSTTTFQATYTGRTIPVDGWYSVAWTGWNPYSADSITLRPSETFNGLTVSISLPPGASASLSGSTVTWPSGTVSNSYYAQYDWPGYSATSASWYSLVAYDQGNFVFGSDIRGVYSKVTLYPWGL